MHTLADQFDQMGAPVKKDWEMYPPEFQVLSGGGSTQGNTRQEAVAA